MNRKDLQKLAVLRIKEAEILLDNQCYEGAYYLAGYAVECALKACFAKQIQKHEFPDRKNVNDSYTHNLDKLLEISGVRGQFQAETRKKPVLQDNWSTVRKWSEQSRYTKNISEIGATEMLFAINDSNNGVLSCLKKLW